MITNTGNEPITEVSFSIGDNIDSCYQNLQDRGFNIVEGDIRIGSGKKFVAIGYKRGTSNFPITNIIGFLSDHREDSTIYENGYEYRMIRDGNGNGDIHKGSGGVDLYFYYTNNIYCGTPIKDLIFASYPKKKRSTAEVVKNCSRSIRQGELDVNARRGSKTPFNYIFIVR